MKTKTVNIPSISIEGLTRFVAKDVILPPNQEWKLIIDYPIDKANTFPFQTTESGMGLGGILGEVGKAYSEIYKSPKKYGVWGHGIGDLVLDIVKVDFVRKQITLGVSS